MELDLELTPEDGAEGSLACVGLSSPLGGKHQRDLSLSAKWASNKALALEYLQRQREAILWIESVLERKLPRDLFEALKSGIVLREVLVKLYPEPTAQCTSPISRRYSLTMAPWKERENISIFLKHCKSMGMNDTFLFCTDDLYEGTNMVQVLFSIQHFMAFSRAKSRYLFKPIEQESITFSNQELEMALSKIEQAGVDVNALLTSAPSSASPSPTKPHVEEKAEASSDETPSTASSDSTSDAIEAKEDPEPAEDASETKEDSEPAENECEASDGVDDETAALEELELELSAHENNNNLAVEENDINDIDQHIFAEEAEEIIGSAGHTFVNEAEEAMPEGEMEAHNFEAERQLPDFEEEAEEQDLAVLQALADAATEAEIFAFAAAELDESIVLLEIMDDMLCEIERSAYAAKHAEESRSIEEMAIPGDIEVVRLSSADLTDKHDTYVGDSLAPTVPDTNAVAEPETRANRFSRAARASKKASKAAKKTKQRQSSNESLDIEAMSKCTCGSKCTIM